MKGFQKVHLKKGESKLLSIRIAKKQLRYFDTQIGAWAFEEGVYNLQVGQSRNRILASGSFLLDGQLD